MIYLKNYLLLSNVYLYNVHNKTLMKLQILKQILLLLKK